MAGLTDSEVEEIKSVLLKVDETITKMAVKAGLVNEDSKIELAFDDKRRLMMADVVSVLKRTCEFLDSLAEILVHCSSGHIVDW